MTPLAATATPLGAIATFEPIAQSERIEALALTFRIRARELSLLMAWVVVSLESLLAFPSLQESHVALLAAMAYLTVAAALDPPQPAMAPWRLRAAWLPAHALAASVCIAAPLPEAVRVVAGIAAFASLVAAGTGPGDLAIWKRKPFLLGGASGTCAVAIAVLALGYAQTFWNGSAGASTIAAVAWVLRWMDPAVSVSGARVEALGFPVTIGPGCSGLEGMALIALFTGAWLAWFRAEYRFPHALSMIPVGVGLSWLLNVGRIVILILIGAAGHRDVALGGFHSQAGWILFTGLAISMCSVSARIVWIRASREETAAEDSTVAWLAPFLAIQIGSMLSAAAKGDFEWLYPLRAAAGAAAVAWYWKRVPKLSIGRDAVVAGLVIVVAWVAAAWTSAPVTAPFERLSALAEPWRTGWIALRIFGAVAVVPVAEELAFRGVLQPRFGLAASSLAFGFLHGSRWLPGIVAGVLLGRLYTKTGRLGDCMAAHALANLMLLGVVWFSGDWRFW